MVTLRNKDDFEKILSLKSFGYFHPSKKIKLDIITMLKIVVLISDLTKFHVL